MNQDLSRDLEKIIEWGKKNRVSFNASKTQCTHLTHRKLVPSQNLSLSGIDIAEADTLSLLGLTIQNDMRWNTHIISVAKEASKCLGFLKRCRKYFSASDIRKIYVSYIRPRMEYNSHVWTGASRSSLELLDRVQRRAIKIIGDKSISDSLESLEHRRCVGSISLFYRYFNGNCSREVHELLPELKTFGRSTRSSSRAHSFHMVEIPE